MQWKKNPRESQIESHDGFEDPVNDMTTNEPAIPSFGDEPARPSWRRTQAASPVSERPVPALGPAAAAPPPALEVTPAVQGESVLDALSSFDGRYETPQDLRVLGTVSGDVVCGGQLTIERDATAKARIQARDVVARGHIEGEVTCTGKLVIEPGAIVTGTVRTATLVVLEGATLRGSIEMNGEAAPITATASRSSRREAAAAAEPVAVESAAQRTARGRDLPSFALVSSDERVAGERNPASIR